MSDDKLFTRILTLLSVVFLLLVCVTTALMFRDRELQSEVNGRQQYINQSVQLTSINEALVRALAAASVKDTAIRQILTDTGLNVTYRSNDNQPEASSTASPKPTPEKR